jgi:hypothetical protein
MAQQKISQSFDVSADKVVAFGELRKKRTEVYNANLSIPERLYLISISWISLAAPLSASASLSRTP